LRTLCRYASSCPIRRACRTSPVVLDSIRCVNSVKVGVRY
jgi:hypothetical protein